MTFRLLGLLFFLLPHPLLAHPHVWADVRTEITVEAGYVEGLWSTWTFDEVFSQVILMDHDTDGNGRFSAPENTILKKGYFDNLRIYRYFTHLALGSRSLETPTPNQFQGSVTSDGRVVFRFFLPLGLRLDAKTPLAVSFYDDTFFTDMIFDKKSPVNLKVTDGGKASFVLRPDKSKTYYSGQVTPTYAFISWSPS